jgi:flagellar FliL protein
MVDANGFNQVLSLVVAIEVADPKDQEKVTNMMPRLQDAFIQQMYGEMNDQGYVKNGVIQVPKLKGRLNAIADEVLGEDLARDVLLQVIQQRPV